jgi:hypothetical protein
MFAEKGGYVELWNKLHNRILLHIFLLSKHLTFGRFVEMSFLATGTVAYNMKDHRSHVYIFQRKLCSTTGFIDHPT